MSRTISQYRGKKKREVNNKSIRNGERTVYIANSVLIPTRYSTKRLEEFYSSLEHQSNTRSISKD